MTSKDRWLDEGMTVLREQGIAGVRVDRIAARLGLTKGSFHHHFDGVGDYRRALLERYESDTAAIVQSALSALAGLSPEQALMALPAHVPVDPRTDAAVRGWAFEDDEARATLERIDAARLQVLVALWQAIVADPALARAAAMIPHLITMGASVALPTPRDDEMAAVFGLLAALVPAVREQSPPVAG